jgi:hypothetical protein
VNERRRIPWKPFAAIAVAVVAVNALALALRTSAPGPRGPAHSAYATSPRGLAAYASLLERHGHRVARVVERPEGARLDPDSVAFVVDPDFVTADDVRALRRFVAGGGRAVVAVDRPARWLGALLAPATPPEWDVGLPGAAHPLAPAAEVDGVRKVELRGEGAWTATGGALPVLGTASDARVAVASLGKGRVVLVADPSPLENRGLAHADDALLGLDLAGAGRRPVVFVEGVHGFGRATGLRAIPLSWWVVLAGLAAAALVYVFARGRRLGPPERAERELPPARSMYVAALGARLAAARDREATVGTLGRELDRRLAVPFDDPEARARAFDRFGVPAADRGLIEAAEPNAATELALGRAVAAVYAAQTPLAPEEEERA